MTENTNNKNVVHKNDSWADMVERAKSKLKSADRAMADVVAAYLKAAGTDNKATRDAFAEELGLKTSSFRQYVSAYLAWSPSLIRSLPQTFTTLVQTATLAKDKELRDIAIEALKDRPWLSVAQARELVREIKGEPAERKPRGEVDQTDVAPPVVGDDPSPFNGAGSDVGDILQVMASLRTMIERGQLTAHELSEVQSHLNGLTTAVHLARKAAKAA